MTEFVIGIAGCKVGIRSVFEETKQYCGEYLTEGTPDFTVEMCQADIDREREHSDRERKLEGLTPANHSDKILETTAVYRKIVEKLLGYDVLLFHGSVVAVDGVAYMFTAVSGTGKSTHTKLWRKLFGERAVMINDDKPLFKITPTGILVCGTPWDGKHRLSCNNAVPLQAVCILERSTENHIRAITPSEALPMLLQQTYRPRDAAAMARTLSLVDRLAGAVKLWRLGCNMDIEAAEVAWNAMRG